MVKRLIHPTLTLAMHCPGVAWSFERNSFAPTTLSKAFDGLFFIDVTTRARPNPSVNNVIEARLKVVHLREESNEW